VISALAKNSTNAYDTAVMKAKLEWLKKHLASVRFDEIRFVPYTYTKNNANNGNDILFDDEARHLEAWTGEAINAKNLLVSYISGGRGAEHHLPAVTEPYAPDHPLPPAGALP
jgi:hypothetical protein